MFAQLGKALLGQAAKQTAKKAPTAVPKSPAYTAELAPRLVQGKYPLMNSAQRLQSGMGQQGVYGAQGAGRLAGNSTDSFAGRIFNRTFPGGLGDVGAPGGLRYGSATNYAKPIGPSATPGAGYQAKQAAKGAGRAAGGAAGATARAAGWSKPFAGESAAGLAGKIGRGTARFVASPYTLASEGAFGAYEYGKADQEGWMSRLGSGAEGFARRADPTGLPADLLAWGAKPFVSDSTENTIRQIGAADALLNLTGKADLIPGEYATGPTGRVITEGENMAQQYQDEAAAIRQSVDDRKGSFMGPTSAQAQQHQANKQQKLADHAAKTKNVVLASGYGAEVQNVKGFFEDPNSKTGWSFSNGAGLVRQNAPDPHAYERVLEDGGTRRPRGMAADTIGAGRDRWNTQSLAPPPANMGLSGLDYNVVGHQASADPTEQEYSKRVKDIKAFNPMMFGL